MCSFHITRVYYSKIVNFSLINTFKDEKNSPKVALGDKIDSFEMKNLKCNENQNITNCTGNFNMPV